MSSVVRSVLGAALLLTGTSAAMAQSANVPSANQTIQTSASNTTQTGASAAAAASNSAAADSSRKPTAVADKSDLYGGQDPNSQAGNRAFWETINPY